jgi:hypothetical protein
VHLPGQHTIFDKSHSDWSGAPRHVYPKITPRVSSTPVKDGGWGVVSSKTFKSLDNYLWTLT